MWLRKESMVKDRSPAAGEEQQGGGSGPVPLHRPVLGVVEWSMPYKYGYLNTQVGSCWPRGSAQGRGGKPCSELICHLRGSRHAALQHLGQSSAGCLAWCLGSAAALGYQLLRR